MSKRLLGILTVAVLLGVPAVSQAAQFVYEENRLVIREPVNEDLYAAAGDVVIDAPIVGDVYLAGASVLVRSTIEEDLFIGGGRVRVAGEVKGDLRIGGGEVVIQGPVAGDVIVIGGNVEITREASVGGDLVAAVGQLTIDPAPNIIQGSIVRYQPPAREGRGWGAARGSIAWLLSSLIMTLLLGYGLPAKSAALAKQWRAQFGMNVLIGLLFFLAVPLGSVVLLMTVIGIPLAAIALALYALLLYVGKLVATLAVGFWIQSLWTKQDGLEPIWASATLGVLLLALLGAVPLVGWILVCLIFLAGLGALVRYDWNLVKNLRQRGDV